MTTAGYATCPGCGRRIVVRSDDRIRPHFIDATTGIVCAGAETKVPR